MKRILLFLILYSLTSHSVSAHRLNEHWADVNGTMLRYEYSVPTSANEDTQTLVLLHEMTMSLESWDFVIDDLQQDFKVLRYDLRGFGLSQKVQGSVTFEDHSQDLAALLEKLGIEDRVILIGGALGAAVAIQFAADYPQQAKGVVGFSPATQVSTAERPPVMAMAARVQGGNMREFVDGDLDYVYPPEIQNEAGLLKFRALQYANDPDSMAATLRMIAITEWDDTFASVQCPVLAVATTLFKDRPPASIQAIVRKMPKGQYAALETGHFAALQSPELVLPLIRKFVDSVSN